jgi:hypothetical protein
MNRAYALLPALAAIALVFAAPIARAATNADMEWQNYEQAYGSSMPPKTDADCAKYTTDAVKTECMNRINRQPTFTYRVGDSRANADQAAIRYCTTLGKTFEMKSESTDGTMITYNCK